MFIASPRDQPTIERSRGALRVRHSRCGAIPALDRYRRPTPTFPKPVRAVLYPYGMPQSTLADMIGQYESELLSAWIEEQSRTSKSRGGTAAGFRRETAQEFLLALREALLSTSSEDITGSEYSQVREILTDLSRRSAENGITPTEMAGFVFSLKQPLFVRLRQKFSKDGEGLANEVWRVTVLLDKLGLLTTEVYQRDREDIIRRQQQEMLELSTPVVRLWERVLALPLIGTLDSARTQTVMQNLLQAIVDTGAAIAIIDITGVPTVDTVVAQHLLKTVAAARLMGADCIISGIRPQIAQTIIHLGVELSEVTTKATLADAFQVALRRLGMSVVTAKA
jgi:rsbT co-antagonist protein RsbR